MSVIRSLMIRIGVDLTEAQKGMKQAAKDLDKLGRTLSSAGRTLTTGITVPALAVATAMGAVVMKTSAAAVELVRLSDVTGLSTDRIQELQYVGAQLGVSLETITDSQRYLTKAMTAAQKGTKEQSDIFKVLGVSVTDSSGHLRNANDVFADAIDALGSMHNDAERDAMALKLFGRSAMDLNPLIKAGGDAIRSLSSDAHANGAVISNESVVAMEQFHNSIESLQLTLTNAASQIVMAFLPALESFLPIIQNNLIPAFQSLALIISGVLDWFMGLSPSTQNFILVLGGIVLAIGPVLSSLGSMATGLSSLIKLFSLLGTSATASAAATAKAAAMASTAVTTSSATAALSVQTAAVSIGTSLSAVTLGLYAAVAALALFIIKWNNDGVAAFQAANAADIALAGSAPTPVPGAAPPKTPAIPGSLGPYKPGTGPYATDKNGVPNWWNPNYGKAPDPAVVKALEETKKAAAADPYADILARQNALLKEQQDELNKTSAAAKAAAALEAFRSTVKSLAQSMLDATKQFANFTGAFDRVDRDPISGTRLANRMKGQLKAIQDWAAAMKELKGKVSAALYSELLNLGPGAVDEILALANNSQALADYASAWQQKYDVAAGMGAEAAKENYRVDQLIERQINTINVTGADPEKVADLVVRKLRLAGVR